MSLIRNASKNIAGRLAWHTANRYQAGIAKDLAKGEDIPEVYGLGEAGLFDEFFYFLDKQIVLKIYHSVLKKIKLQITFLRVRLLVRQQADKGRIY